MKVVFPAPFCPTMATCSPALIFADTFLRMYFSVFGYLKLTFLNSISHLLIFAKISSVSSNVILSDNPFSTVVLSNSLSSTATLSTKSI